MIDALTSAPSLFCSATLSYFGLSFLRVDSPAIHSADVRQARSGLGEFLAGFPSVSVPGCFPSSSLPKPPCRVAFWYTTDVHCSPLFSPLTSHPPLLAQRLALTPIPFFFYKYVPAWPALLTDTVTAIATATG